MTVINSFKRAMIACCVLLPFGQSASADILWDNGSIVTHVGAGFGGADVSMASLVPNTGGSNVTAVVWRADNFSVSGPGWLVDSIEAFAYDTNFAVPRFGAAQMNVHSSEGGVPGAILASTAATWEYSGINRVFNGVANIGNTARQVQRLTGNFGGLQLSAGDYFFSYSVSNTEGVNNWFPYVMDINPLDPNDPITRVGNGLVSVDSGATWVAGIVGTGGWNQAAEVPFIVNGSAVPEPGSFVILLSAAAGVLVRRRR